MARQSSPDLSSTGPIPVLHAVVRDAAAFFERNFEPGSARVLRGISGPAVVGTPAEPDRAPAAETSESLRWLVTSSMGGARQACAAFLGLAERLLEQPLRPDETAILEEMHPRVLDAIAQHSRRFAGKPLPLQASESLAQTEVSSLCRAMGRCYRRLLQAILPEGSLQARPGASLAMLRSIEYAALAVNLCHMARREVPPEYWQELHGLYAEAERLQLAQIAVGGSAAHKSEAAEPQTCTAAYVRPLLQALAHPYGLPGRESRWLAAWLQKWGPKAAVVPWLDAPAGFCVQLDAGTPPIWTEMPPKDAAPVSSLSGSGQTRDAAGRRRFLDMASLRRSLRKRLHLLDAGHTPAALGLGQDCTQPATSLFLKSLLADWSRGTPLQQHRRRAARAEAALAEVAIGTAAAYQAMHGTALDAAAEHGPAAAEGGPHTATGSGIWQYAGPRRGEVYNAALDRRAEAPERFTAPGGALESWRILDESAVGFRLRRDAALRGARIAHQQLVAVRPHGASMFILAEVRWLMQDVAQNIQVGTRALPGLAQPCAVRVHSPDAGHSVPFACGFLLDAPRGLPASLILPPGSHAPGRRLDVHLGGRLLCVALDELLQRGYDYERATFTPAAA